jgi:hypothetical protein
MTSGAKSDGRFGKQDFVDLPAEDVYRCPAGEKLTYRYTNEEDGNPGRPPPERSGARQGRRLNQRLKTLLLSLGIGDGLPPGV